MNDIYTMSMFIIIDEQWDRLGILTTSHKLQCLCKYYIILYHQSINTTLVTKKAYKTFLLIHLLTYYITKEDIFKTERAVYKILKLVRRITNYIQIFMTQSVKFTREAVSEAGWESNEQHCQKLLKNLLLFYKNEQSDRLTI